MEINKKRCEELFEIYNTIPNDSESWDTIHEVLNRGLVEIFRTWATYLYGDKVVADTLLEVGFEKEFIEFALDKEWRFIQCQ